MRKSIYTYAFLLALPVAMMMSSCEPRALTEEDVFSKDSTLAQILTEADPQGYDIYNLNDFLDTFMSEAGNLLSDSSVYRRRSTNGNGIYLYSIDTIRLGGRGIYIRGRITTDDFGGNFYKSMVIQQTTDWKTGSPIDQQNLRLSVDMGSSGGMYQVGQEIIIRCNGLAVGRYANQPQLCYPSYNNNINALVAGEKVGWNPGRIPSAVFRRATRMIGMPDQSKLQYDTLTIKKLFAKIDSVPTLDAAGMDKIRKFDGRLVVIRNVYFNGKFYDQGDISTCEYDDPEKKDSKANVFAPTTTNVGYPQNRIIQDLSDNPQYQLCVSNSEYCKFAYYFLPGADTLGVVGCKYYDGSVTGILGWYVDNATGTKAGTLKNLSKYAWSITPRGIPGIGLCDINMSKKDPITNDTTLWVPEEFDPVKFQAIQANN